MPDNPFFFPPPETTAWGVALALAAGAFSIALRTARWWILLRALGVSIGPARVAACTVLGSGVAAVSGVPGLGDLVRWLLLGRIIRDYRRSGASVVADLLTAFAGAAILWPAGVIWLAVVDGVPIAKLRAVACAFVLGVGVLLGIALLMRPQMARVLAGILPAGPIARTSRAIARAMAAFHATPRTLSTAVVLSVIAFTSSHTVTFYIATELRTDAAGISPVAATGGPLLRAVLANPEMVWVEIDRNYASSVGVPGRDVLLHWDRWMRSVFSMWFALPALLIWLAAPRRASPPETAWEEYGDLGPAETRQWRNRFAWTVAASAGGGLLAGAIFGPAEAAWILAFLHQGLTDAQALPWSALVYAPLFAMAGAAAAFGLIPLGFAAARFPSPQASMALVFGGALGAATLVVGRFRYARDILGDHALGAGEMATLGAVSLTIACLAGLTAYLVGTRLGSTRARLLAPFAIWSMTVAAAALGAGMQSTPVSPSAPSMPAREAGGPPIILIVLDTLRADYLSLYRPDAPARTPNLNAFAQDAVLFRRAFAQAPWTKPSFATLFTGLYPQDHGAVGKNSVLPESMTTLAELLGDAGYMTCGFPNNPNITPAYGFAQGFASYTPLKPLRYFAADESTEMLALYQVLRRVHFRLTTPHIDVAHFYRPAPGVNEAVRQWLSESPARGTAPPFLFIHYMDPHDPYQSYDRPGEAYAFSAVGEQPDPALWRDRLEKSYIYEIEYLDAHLDDLFEMLRTHRLYDEALIVITSDHGEEFCEHGGWRHGDTLYEEVLAVPLFIKLPGNRSGGMVNPYMARHVDVAPTILAAAGVLPAPPLPGIPLLDDAGRFQNALIRYSHAETNFLETVGKSVRSEDAKRIEIRQSRRARMMPVEFYDLAVDPAESLNRSSSGDPREAELAEAIRLGPAGP